ncbi:MAG: hypothetical protein N2117_02840 [Anaerolineales bacterium]|nr:hypothetical protein [Anaerolineales bacterium]MDW8276980.1 hypothetical protein [Anaerolineales bacterium]
MTLRLRELSWMSIPMALLGLIFLFGGTFVYIDGDDAASIAYHVMGRNPQLHLPYSPYHGMMDRLLSLFPAQEPLLRVAAFSLTRLAGIGFVLLALQLAFDWLKQTNIVLSPSQKALTALTLLLAAPELAYLSLTYSPTLIAMCLALGAHLLARQTLRTRELSPLTQSLRYAAALLLFGLGASFRWNVTAYALVIAADLWVSETIERQPTRWLCAILGGGLAGLSALLLIAFSGYGLTDFLARLNTVEYVMNQAGSLGPQADAPLSEILLRSGLTLTPLLTPAFVGLALLGFGQLARQRHPLLLPILAGLLSALPWLKSGVPKFIITSLPPMVFLMALGLWMAFTFARKKRAQTAFTLLLAAVLLLPWGIGIRLSREDSAWGPGFQARRFDEPSGETGVSFQFGAGAAFPTPEGVRPLYGHGWVLLREWKTFTETAAAEREQVVETALQRNLPIVVTNWSPDYYLNALYARGFQTTDPHDRPDKNGFFTERRFEGPDGKTVVLRYGEIEGETAAFLLETLSRLPDAQTVLLTGYPRTLRTLYQERPHALQALGVNSALLNLAELRQP